jgi:hypothetical protein
MAHIGSYGGRMMKYYVIYRQKNFLDSAFASLLVETTEDVAIVENEEVAKHYCLNHSNCGYREETTGDTMLSNSLNELK